MERNSVREQQAPWCLYLKPSRVASFFEHDCDRLLALESLRRGLPESVTPPGQEGSAAGETASTLAGNLWEKQIAGYLAARYDVRDLTGLYGEEAQAALLEALAAPFSEPKGMRFLYQAEFRVKDPFPGRARQEKAPCTVAWSAIRPDLLLVEPLEDGSRRVSIIDVKLSGRSRTQQKMQVGLYALLLGQFLKERCAEAGGWRQLTGSEFLLPDGTRLSLDMETCYLWNRTGLLKDWVTRGEEPHSPEALKAQWNAVSCREVMPFLRELLDTRIDALAKAAAADPDGEGEEILRGLPFSMGANCGGCRSCGNCIAWAERDNSVQLYPGLSRPAQRFLRQLAKEHGPELLTVPGLKDVLTGDTAKTPENRKLAERLKSSHTWRKMSFPGSFQKWSEMLALRRRPERMLAQSEEARQKLIRRMRIDRVSSLRLPVRQDAAVTLTVQHGLTADGTPVCYAYGIHLRIGKKAQGVFTDDRGQPIRAWSTCFAQASASLCPRQDRSEGFVRCLHRLLRDAAAYNRAAEDFRKPITLQGYVFERSEYEAVESLLYRVLSSGEEELRQQAREILFWLQGDGITGALETHPASIVAFPLVVLSEELRKLYEIPAYITVQLWNAAMLFLGKDFREETGQHCSRLSDGLRQGAFYAPDSGQRLPGKDPCAYLKKRLQLQSDLLLKVQKCSWKSLQRSCGTFVLPAASGLEDPALSRLRYQAQNEDHLQRSRYQNVLMQDPAGMIAGGGGLLVQTESCVREKTFLRLVCRVLQAPRSGRVGMTEAYLLPMGSKKAVPEYTMNALRAAVLSGETRDFAVARAVRPCQKDGSGTGSYVTFRVAEKYLEARPDAGDRFLLLDTPPVGQLANELLVAERLSTPEGSSIRTLLHPERYAAPHALIPGKRGEELLPYGQMGGSTFAPGQDEAFCHVCDHNITLLQGPPGTGKTDFIARTVVALIRANQQANQERNGERRPLRILVSAFTHAAINNALKKICEKAAEEHLHLRAGRDGAWDDTDFELAVYKNREGPGQSFLIEDVDTILHLDSRYDPTKSHADGAAAENREAVDDILWLESLYAGTESDLEALMLFSEEGEVEEEALPAETPRPEAQPVWKNAFRSAGTSRAVVVGATCWACRKANPFLQQEPEGLAEDYFDLIIIDEASQMLVLQSLMVMSFGRPEHTHFLIVGDNHQLPPILQGTYVPARGEADLYHSVFQFYLDAAGQLPPEQNFARALGSNFRMNEALCNYSAEKIYHLQKQIRIRYSGFNAGIREQKLSLVPGWEEGLSLWERQILDPEYPLVTLYLSDAAPDSLSRCEAALVSRITLLLQERMARRDGNRYFDPEDWEQSMYAFWGVVPEQEEDASPLETVSDPAFGILSPYHRQIRLLKERITADMEARYGRAPAESDLLVDTVNKLQGQERQAVIVSYGISDSEEAVAQGSFAYNYQRLNVALTRGKKKTILLLTSALAERPIEMLDSHDRELLYGVSFLCGLKDYLQQPQPEFESRAGEPFELEGVRVELWRKRYTGGPHRP